MTEPNGNAQTAEPTAAPQIDDTTLRGDVRDAVLTEFKHMAKPWQQMNEEEQQRCINRASDIASTVTRRAVDLVAARGLPALAITIGKFTVEASEMKGTFSAYPSDDNLLQIRHLCDRRAMFVLADAADYMGEKKPAAPENVGTLAIPTMGPGAPSDPDALATVGRGPNAKPPRKGKDTAPFHPPPDDEPRVADPS